MWGLSEEAREEDEEHCDDEQCNCSHPHEQQSHKPELVGHFQKSIEAFGVVFCALDVACDVLVQLADYLM